MRLLLDTAVVVFAVESPERISKRAALMLKDEQNSLELSAISLSEIAIKAARGKLGFTESDVKQAIQDLDIRILNYTASHGFLLFHLPMYHNDPFDRQIIAQAISEDIPVVSPDRQFRKYENLQVIW